MQHDPIQSVVDLVASTSFKKWIIHHDEEEGQYWQQWIKDNPEKLEWVETARTVILLLNDQEHFLPEQEIALEAAAIQRRITESEDIPVLQTRVIPMRRKWWIAAAAILLLITTSFFLYINHRQPDTEIVLADNIKKVVFENTADTNRIVALPDGSRVTLEKGARLLYGYDDSLKLRITHLTGNAFFDIAHDPTHPFMVFTSSIVTRVLGTSFWIKAAPDNHMASVIVRTGKVSVFKKEDFPGNSKTSRALPGVVLSANQQVNYDLDNGKVQKDLVAAPVADAKKTDTVLVFDATPAIAAFKQLEAMYVIPIVVDEKALASCSITATLDNENFYEKLNMLCKVINASYEVIDGTIVITARGCK